MVINDLILQCNHLWHPLSLGMYCDFLDYSVHSFVEVARYLLSLPGKRSLLSERFSQDPLESFFGKQRARGGRNENPTAQQFLDSTVSLRIQRSLALEPVRGNCRKRPSIPQPEIDPTPLPKRRKVKS